MGFLASKALRLWEDLCDVAACDTAGVEGSHRELCPLAYGLGGYYADSLARITGLPEARLRRSWRDAVFGIATGDRRTKTECISWASVLRHPRTQQMLLQRSSRLRVVQWGFCLSGSRTEPRCPFINCEAMTPSSVLAYDDILRHIDEPSGGSRVGCSESRRQTFLAPRLDVVFENRGPSRKFDTGISISPAVLAIRPRIPASCLI